MFSRTLTEKSMKSYSESIEGLKNAIQNADAVLIGAGSGLSTAAGFTYTGERFYSLFLDFIKKYHFTDMYSGGFYPYETLEEYWAWWSRYIHCNRYTDIPKNTYKSLLKLVENKNYFVITTNVDHCFQKSGFDKDKLYYMQGDYGLLQCSKPCHQKTYDNEEIIKRMVESEQNMRIPSELIPRCPICNAPMVPNLRADDTFVQDEGWYIAEQRYNNFIENYKDRKIVFLELGVGYNTPVWIKYPFWEMTAENQDAVYACINYDNVAIPDRIVNQSVCIKSDINRVLSDLMK